MSPAASMSLALVLVSLGLILMILAFGMWLAARKYPAAEPPADRSERAICLVFLGVGAYTIALGCAL